MQLRILVMCSRLSPVRNLSGAAVLLCVSYAKYYQYPCGAKGFLFLPEDTIYSWIQKERYFFVYGMCAHILIHGNAFVPIITIKEILAVFKAYSCSGNKAEYYQLFIRNIAVFIFSCCSSR